MSWTASIKGRRFGTYSSASQTAVVASLKNGDRYSDAVLPLTLSHESTRAGGT